jgi:hypothetical protein
LKVSRESWLPWEAAEWDEAEAEAAVFRRILRKLKRPQIHWCAVPTASRERAARKVAALKRFLGGRCLLCRFAAWSSALHAHHIWRGEKLKKLKKRKVGISALGEEEFWTEAYKCCLLCANCHAGVEHGSLCLRTAADPGFGPNWEVPDRAPGKSGASQLVTRPTSCEV